MNVTIKFSLSPAGQKALLLSGGDGKSQQQTIVEPTSEHFKQSVEQATILSDGTCVLDLEYQKHFDSMPTVEQLLDVLPSKKRQEQEQLEKRCNEVRAAYQDILTNKKTIEKQCYGPMFQAIVPAWPYLSFPESAVRKAAEQIQTSPEAIAWQAELDAINEQTRANAITKDAADKAEQERIKAERAAALVAKRAERGLQDGDEDYAIEGDALAECPVWGTHSRSKNWMAIISLDNTAPGGLAREFAEKAKGDCFYILPSLEPGDAIEFGADYYTGSGRKNPERWYGYVVRVEPTYLVLRQCKTGKEAIKSGEKIRPEKTAVDTAIDMNNSEGGIVS